ncbi:MAG: methylenetetrahydrofolate reductase [NAD(P)H] [Candidatus Omnitrophota bacterium]
MRISEHFQEKKPFFSFEFFPPKDPEGETRLFSAIAELKKLEPAFVSVTYGAMGTTRDHTLRIVSRLKNEIGIEAAAHLTCIGHGRAEIGQILADLKAHRVENLVALRGDPPKGESAFTPAPDGFCYASELVRFIRSHPEFTKTFDILVAGYPEGHPECRDLVKDIWHLKHKVDQGAEAVITQLFFDNEYYFRFVERAYRAGIKVPIIPGIMPVTHGPQIQKFSAMCGAKIPQEVAAAIRQYGDDSASVEHFGIDFATQQCKGLLDFGAPGLHFYTLNKSKATLEIYTRLGIR